jgi:Uma2 family endonuclease
MAVKSLLSEEEYLRTSFDGVDQEYQDGELVERGMPDDAHSEVQSNSGYFFTDLRKSEGLLFYARTELRHRVAKGRYLIPDLSVHWPTKPTQAVPSTPPLIVIEILSADDRMARVLEKLREYVDWGVPHVWFIDPYKRELATFDLGGLHYVTEFVVPETSRRLTLADLFD